MLTARPRNGPLLPGNGLPSSTKGEANTHRSLVLTQRMRSPSFWIVLPISIAVVLFVGGIAGAGFVADDAFNLAKHANHGDWWGEWTTPTYEHAGGDRGHIWRPIPAWVQHVAASTWGRTGSTFRTINLLVHGANVCMLVLVARRLGASAPAAGLGAILWTTHPTMTEAVCWSSDLYDLMATTGCLFAVYGVTCTTRVKRLSAVIAAMLVACLAKESAMAMLPGLVAVAALAGGRSRVIEAGVAGGTAVAAYSQLHQHVTAQTYMDVARSVPFSEALDGLLMTVGWWAHTPARAPMAHLFDSTGDHAEITMGAAVLVATSIAVAHLFRQQHPRYRWLLAAFIAAAGLSVPAAMGIPYIGVAPFRYAYTPLAIGICIGSSAWTGPIGKPWIVAAAVFAAVGSFRIADRVPDFQNDATLWSAELKHEPNNPYAAGNLARAKIASGDIREAMVLWTRAIESAPPGIRVFRRSNERWLLAQTAFMKGHPRVALEQTTRLLNEGGAENPAMAHCLLADSLDALGRHQEAAAAGQRCRP